MSKENDVDEFIKLTGASIEVAKMFLKACSGNLEMAVGMHLDQISSAQRVDNGENYELTHGVRAPIPQSQGVLIEQESTRRTLRRRNLPPSVFDPFQDYSGTHSTNSSACISDKQRTLAELFKPPSDITFHGTFQEARLAGQLQHRWLLVNVQDSHEFKCQVLNRDVWNNAEVKKLLQDHFIFLQIQRITDDGIKFRQLYGIDSFPALIIIDPRTGEKVKKWNDVTREDFISKVQEFLLMNSLEDNKQKQQPTCIYNQSEEEQVEAAIRASLEDVQESKSYCDSEEGDDNLSHDSSNGDVKSDTGFASPPYIVGHKRSYNNIYSPFPKKPCLENISDKTCESHKQCSHILIRYPDGRRSIKSFPADYQIKELFIHLEEQGIDLSKYEVITTFPKQIISSLPHSITFREARLFPSETIFIQSIEI